MKKILLSLATAMAALGGSQLGAATYTDTTGENFTGAGGGILDISSVEVNNTATDLIFKINVTGDPVATDWGKYMIGINTGVGPNDTAGNGWGRPIVASYGMNYWMGSWVDSGNAVQVWQFNPTWAQIGAVGTFAGGPAVAGLSITKNTSSITITAPLSLLSLTTGNSFNFDVFTSGGGGGDSAVDALNNPLQSISDWGGPPTPYNSGVVVPSSYTVTAVPEPSLLAFLALGGVAMGGYLVRRKI